MKSRRCMTPDLAAGGGGEQLQRTLDCKPQTCARARAGRSRPTSPRARRAPTRATATEHGPSRHHRRMTDGYRELDLPRLSPPVRPQESQSHGCAPGQSVDDYFASRPAALRRALGAPSARLRCAFDAPSTRLRGDRAPPRQARRCQCRRRRCLRDVQAVAHLRRGAPSATASCWASCCRASQDRQDAPAIGPPHRTLRRHRARHRRRPRRARLARRGLRLLADLIRYSATRSATGRSTGSGTHRNIHDRNARYQILQVGTSNQPSRSHVFMYCT